ncbi:unnamed protein product [Effrenium voratum]|nr:unnamed protein product [Effrenium voratum]
MRPAPMPYAPRPMMMHHPGHAPIHHGHMHMHTQAMPQSYSSPVTMSSPRSPQPHMAAAHAAHAAHGAHGAHATRMYSAGQPQHRQVAFQAPSMVHVQPCAVQGGPTPLPGQLPMQAVRSLPHMHPAHAQGAGSSPKQNPGSPTSRMVKVLSQPESEESSPKMQKAYSEMPIRGIIKKFELAMSQSSESTRSSSLQELDEAAANALAELGEEPKKTKGSAMKKSSSISSLRMGEILSRSTTLQSIPLTVRSPRSVQRMSSQPSLKAAALASAGSASPRSPRSPGGSRRSKGVSRSTSANIGLLEGRFGRSTSGELSPRDTSVEVRLQTMQNLRENNDLASSFEEYQTASQRVKAMHKQLAKVATEASKSPVANAIEEDEDEDGDGMQMCATRSLRESSRLASKRIRPLGDTDSEYDDGAQEF